jgi:hypothetical protein
MKPLKHAPRDNPLLASCGPTRSYVPIGAAAAAAYGAAVGVLWFLCVAYRAGALTWSF